MDKYIITEDYLRKFGFRKSKVFSTYRRGFFKKENMFWGYKFELGSIEIAICAIENNDSFYYKLKGHYIGLLPESKKFLKQLIKYYG